MLLLPATINWNDLGFNFSEFMQSVGRVGRGGDLGKATVILYGIPVDDPNAHTLVPAARPLATEDNLIIHYRAAIN